MAAGSLPWIAGLVASFLVGAGAAFAVRGPGELPAPPGAAAPPPGPANAQLAGPHLGSAPFERALAQRDGPPDLSHDPPFPLEDGQRPTLDEAREFSRKYSRFIAKENEGLDKLRAEGYLSGDGTPQSPYVLERFYVDGELTISNSGRSLILREGYVAGQLTLNYVGESLYVHHVYADDLRINENVKRNGTNSGGLFHDNHFAFVGQIRHFVGEFRDNQVGPRPAGAIAEALGDTGVVRVAPGVVFNFDGFHGADVHDNLFLGMVDIKLHGHNHADCFVCSVHDHSDETQFPGGDHDHGVGNNSHGFASRHSVRYVSLLFQDNEIRVPSGTALRYNDRNHAGDDRTANSEPNPRLEDPHVHYQDVTIRGNRLVGGSLFVDIFNAEDDRHTTQNLGGLRLWDNEVAVHYAAPSATRPSVPPQFGVRLSTADGLELDARGNKISFVEEGADEPGSSIARTFRGETELQGFRLEAVDASNLTLSENAVASGRFGVWAQTLSESTYWFLFGNDFRTDEPWRGKDVSNPPEEDP